MDIEFTGFYDFVVNQAKEIDNLELKAKRQKSLIARVNQHQQGNANNGNGKDGKDKTPRKPPAWKSDPDFSDFKSTSHTADKWKNMSHEDKQKHFEKEKTRRAEHKKKKEAERARQRQPRQANSHNTIATIEVIPEEDTTTQTLIPSDEPGGSSGSFAFNISC